MIKAYKQKHQQIIKNKINKFANVDCPMWVLSFDHYQKADTPRILKKTEQIFIQTFILTNTKRSTIIQQISVTFYACLRVLNLSVNNIESIEGLRKLDAPQLTHLSLDHNLITSIQALSRANFPRLKHLSLYRNKIKALDNKFNGHWPKLGQLNIKSNFKFFNLRPFLKTNLKIQGIAIDETDVMKNQKNLVAEYLKKRNTLVMNIKKNKRFQKLSQQVFRKIIPA